jgi:hypothetical protein
MLRCTLLVFLWVGSAFALEVPPDPVASQRLYSVVADATATPAGILLRVLDGADGDVVVVERREFLSTAAFTRLGDISFPDSTWLDTTARTGVRYHHRLTRQVDGQTATGHLVTGQEIDATGHRGHVVAVVEDNVATTLAVELQQLQEDLINDGWSATRIDRPRALGWADQSGVQQLREAIQTTYNLAATDDKPTQLWLLGHLPVARAGLNAQPPDDHEENRGAYGADAYYADVDGTWTDEGTAPPDLRPFHDHGPNDGRYDNDFLPSDVEMGFGRVDFAELTGIDEVDAMRTYLRRRHELRTGATDIGNRTAFGTNGFVDSVEMGWRQHAGMLGAELTTAISLEEMKAASGSVVAWVRDNGPLRVFSQNLEVPNLPDHEAIGSQALLWSSDQSYFGLWAEPDAPIRGLLTTPGILTGFLWNVGPKHILVELGTGAPMGDCVRTTILHDDSAAFGRPARRYDDQEVFRRTNITLIGDPTMTIFSLAPATVATATATSSGVRIQAEGATTIRIDRATGDCWVQVGRGDASGVVIGDGDVADRYRVRAISLDRTGSGSVWNASLAIPVTWVSEGEGEGEPGNEGEGEPGNEGEGEPSERSAGCSCDQGWGFLAAFALRRRKKNGHHHQTTTDHPRC